MKTNDEGGDREPGRSERERSMDVHEQVLETIRARTGPLTLSELASIIANQQRSELISPRGGAEDEHRLQIRLHHVDLPKLQEQGPIRYDPSRRLVL